MYDKVILENVGTLIFVPDCYKSKKCMVKLLIIIFMQYNLFLRYNSQYMRNKSVDTHHSVI